MKGKPFQPRQPRQENQNPHRRIKKERNITTKNKKTMNGIPTIKTLTDTIQGIVSRFMLFSDRSSSMNINIVNFDNTESLKNFLANPSPSVATNPLTEQVDDETTDIRMFLLINTHGEYNTPPEWKNTHVLRRHVAEARLTTGDQVINPDNRTMKIKKINLASCQAGNVAHLNEKTAQNVTTYVCQGLSCGNPNAEIARGAIELALQPYTRPQSGPAAIARAARAERARADLAYDSETPQQAILYDKTFVWYSSDIAGEHYTYLDDIILILYIGGNVKYYHLVDILIKLLSLPKINAGDNGYKYELKLSELLDFLRNVLFQGVGNPLDVTIIDNSCGSGGQFLPLLSKRRVNNMGLVGGRTKKKQKTKTKNKKQKTKTKTKNKN